jgi:hypothetical protein
MQIEIREQARPFLPDSGGGGSESSAQKNENQPNKLLEVKVADGWTPRRRVRQAKLLR